MYMTRQVGNGERQPVLDIACESAQMGPTPGFSGQAARYRFIVRALDKHSPGTIQSA